ncbi:FAD binding domain-containing protein [Oceaniradius stylonematis]|uniref:FAD binding domain-containing protein n=1 Tax=Oceaniradius stylonematis TaxID=2184161 RepID=UPI00273DA43C|nr:xanthine dehydrogenase family protein subunit M [Oceaniradius stylonematis]
MKAADFLYHRPASVDEAVSLLADYGGAARILAGGQSLLPMMNMRLARPASLIDIRDLDALKDVRLDGDGTVLGALVRYRRIEEDPTIRERLPSLPHLLRWVADRQVRNRGTLGGSLAQADPTGEMPLAALVLGARLKIVGPEGPRSLPVEEFFIGSYATALESREMLFEIRYPRHLDHFAFFEVNRRHNDFAVVSVLVAGNRDGEGKWRGLRIGLGGVDDTPVLARNAMQAVEGGELSDEAIGMAAAEAAAEINPGEDIRGSEAYRRHLTNVYVARALQTLRERGADTES